MHFYWGEKRSMPSILTSQLRNTTLSPDGRDLFISFTRISHKTWNTVENQQINFDLFLFSNKMIQNQASSAP